MFNCDSCFPKASPKAFPNAFPKAFLNAFHSRVLVTRDFRIHIFKVHN